MSVECPECQSCFARKFDDTVRFDDNEGETRCTGTQHIKHYFSAETVVMLVIYDLFGNMDNGPGKFKKMQLPCEISDFATVGEEVVVGSLDVLLGRGKSNETHLGNIKFRST
jgi:hypothetical protein